jgi:Tetracyclin repressor-like, C-terminal domain
MPVLLTHTAAETLAAPHGDVRRVVRRFVRAMVALHAHQPTLHRVLFEEAPLPPRVRQRLARIEGRGTAEVAAWCRDHPRIRRRSPRWRPRSSCRRSRLSRTRWSSTVRGSLDVNAYVDEVVTLVAAYISTSR